MAFDGFRYLDRAMTACVNEAHCGSLVPLLIFKRGCSVYSEFGTSMGVDVGGFMDIEHLSASPMANGEYLVKCIIYLSLEMSLAFLERPGSQLSKVS